MLKKNRRLVKKRLFEKELLSFLTTLPLASLSGRCGFVSAEQGQ